MTTRYCRYEPGYFDDTEFVSATQGVIHEVQPRHYARTGMLVQGPPIASAPFWVPFHDVLAALARDASEPLEGFAPTLPPRADTDEETTRLRLEILRLTDRLSNDDLRTVLNEIRRRLSG
jgi:hypothetical protein